MSAVEDVSHCSEFILSDHNLHKDTASISCLNVSLPTGTPNATVGTASSSQPPMLLLSTNPFTLQVSTDAAGAGMGDQ